LRLAGGRFLVADGLAMVLQIAGVRSTALLEPAKQIAVAFAMRGTADNIDPLAC
jgi:hypothetical protein